MDTITGYTGILDLRVTIRDDWAVATAESKLRPIL